MPPQTPTPPTAMPPTQPPSPDIQPNQSNISPNYGPPSSGVSKLNLSNLFADKSFGKTIGIIAGGAIGLIILLVIVSSIFFKGPDYAGALTPVAQQQFNLANIAQQSGAQFAQNQSVKNLSQDITGVMYTDLNVLQAYLKNVSHKTLSTKTISSTFSSSTLTQLQNANSANNFDTVFLQTVQKDLQTYLVSLKLAYKKIKGAHGRQMLNNDAAHYIKLSTETQNAVASLNTNN